MENTTFEDMQCSIARSLDEVGDWWSLLIVRDVHFGIGRFDALQQSLGISRNTLTRRLNKLASHEILAKIPAEGTGRAEYALTPKGTELWTVLTVLRQWGDRWMFPPGQEPLALDHTTCGHRAHAVLTCSHCGHTLHRHHLARSADPGE